MGISQIMQPRDPQQPRVERPPSPDPALDTPLGVSHGLVPAGDSLSSVPTHELPSKANRKYARKPKPPTDKKLRKTISLILTLKIQGKSRKEIAEELALTENTVKTYLWRAKKKGYLQADDFDDPNDVLETIIKPQVVENIEKLLTWRHPETGLPSMDMTIKTAKGVGIFQSHSVNKGQAGPVQTANVLRVQILMPQAGQVSAREGMMGGRPAVEGEVLESNES